MGNAPHDERGGKRNPHERSYICSNEKPWARAFQNNDMLTLDHYQDMYLVITYRHKSLDGLNRFSMEYGAADCSLRKANFVLKVPHHIIGQYLFACTSYFAQCCEYLLSGT